MAVLYVVVVLMSLNFCARRGVLLVGAGCVALTIFSYILSHDVLEPDSSLGRCLISLLAIVITTLLASRILSAATAAPACRPARSHPEIEPYGSFSWKVPTGELVWSEESYRIYGYDRSVVADAGLRPSTHTSRGCGDGRRAPAAVSRPDADPMPSSISTSACCCRTARRSISASSAAPCAIRPAAPKSSGPRWMSPPPGSPGIPAADPSRTRPCDTGHLWASSPPRSPMR